MKVARIRLADGGAQDVDVIAVFNLFIASTIQSFFLHASPDGIVCSHVDSGQKVCNIPCSGVEPIAQARLCIQQLAEKHGARYMHQRFTEAEVINHNPLSEKENKMSLEEALAKNTAALEAMTVALNRHAVVPDRSVSPPVSDKPAKVEPKVKVEAAPKTAAPAKSEAPALTLEHDVKPLLLKISQSKTADAARAVLKPFGVTKSTELKPEQFADVIAAARKVIDEEDV